MVRSPCSATRPICLSGSSGPAFVNHRRRQEEMWSLGDMLQNLPLLGPLHDLGRRAWGRFFALAFPASCAFLTRLGRRPRRRTVARARRGGALL